MDNRTIDSFCCVEFLFLSTKAFETIIDFCTRNVVIGLYFTHIRKVMLVNCSAVLYSTIKFGVKFDVILDFVRG